MFYYRIDSCLPLLLDPYSVFLALLLFLTLKVVSFFSLRYDTAPTWMVLAVLWCSMVQTLLLPSFIWSCERYRADLRTVWEQCVAIMSEEDTEDGKLLTSPQSTFFTNQPPQQRGSLGKGSCGVVGGSVTFMLQLGVSKHEKIYSVERLCHSLAALGLASRKHQCDILLTSFEHRYIVYVTAKPQAKRHAGPQPSSLIQGSQDLAVRDSKARQGTVWVL